MTKHIHTPDDAPIELSLPIDDIAKVEPDVANLDLLDKNALSICSPHVGPIKPTRTAKAKSTLVRTRTRTKVQTIKVRLGKIMNKLDNIEPVAQPEKPLNIDLGVDLYQMEDL